MKRSTLLMLVLTVVVGMLAGTGLGVASHCGTGAENTHSPFGSCEWVVGGTAAQAGHVDCGAGTVIPGVAVISTPTTPPGGTGIEGCAEDASALPIAGRVGVYRDAAGNVTIFADGDDTTNTGGAAAWDRVDIRPSGLGGDPCKLLVRRGTGGSYWNGQSGTLSAPATHLGNRLPYSGSSAPDSVNFCAA